MLGGKEDNTSASADNQHNYEQKPQAPQKQHTPIKIPEIDIDEDEIPF